MIVPGHALKLQVRLAVDLVGQLRRDIRDQVGLAGAQRDEACRGLGDRLPGQALNFRFGAPVFGFASMTRRSPGTHSTNLYWPVPTGFLATSSPAGCHRRWRHHERGVPQRVQQRGVRTVSGHLDRRGVDDLDALSSA